IALVDQRQLRGIQIGDGRNVRAVELGKVSNEIRPPIAVADDADVDHFLSSCSLLRVSPMTRAGTPATIANGGTSFVTTAPAPTSAPSPILTPARIVALEPMEARRPTWVSTTFQSASVCSEPSGLVARG